jgi:hypothetical protein
LNLLSTGAVVTPLHRDRVGVGTYTERGGRSKIYSKSDNTVDSGPLDRGNASIRVPAFYVVRRTYGGVGRYRCVIETRRRGLRYRCSRPKRADITEPQASRCRTGFGGRGGRACRDGHARWSRGDSAAAPAPAAACGTHGYQENCGDPSERGS